MRILIWTSSYDPVLGGLQVVCSQMADGFTKRGHEVMVLTNRYPFDLSREEIINGIIVKRLVHWSDTRRGWKRWIHSVLGFFQRIRISVLVKKFNPDVISVQYPNAQLQYLLSVSRSVPSVKWVFSFHGHDILRFFKPSKFSENYASSFTQDFKNSSILFQEFMKMNPGRVAFTACSGWLARRVEEYLDSFCTVIYNGIDLSILTTHLQATYNFSYWFAYGRFDHQKGFDILIKAYVSLFRRLGSCETRLIIAGEGSFRKSMEDLVPSDLRDYILIIPRLNFEEIQAYGKFAKAIIIPSRFESFGIVVLESLAISSVVIASDAGGIPEAGGSYCHYFNSEVVTGLEELLFNNYNNELNGNDFDVVTDYLLKFSVHSMVDKYLAQF